MKKVYYSVIIALFLIVFIKNDDVLSSPRKVGVVPELSLKLPLVDMEDIDVVAINLFEEELDDVLIKSKKSKKKKSVHADMVNDPWPIFVNKKLSEKKWTHHSMEEFENSSLGSVSSFLKLMNGESYKKNGLVYKRIENGIVFPYGMHEEDTIRLLDKAQRHNTLDVKFILSYPIDLVMGYQIDTPVFLYDCVIKGKTVFHFMVWRYSKDEQIANVGPVEGKESSDLYPIDKVVNKLNYLNNKNFYKKKEIIVKSPRDARKKGIFIDNFSKVTSSVLDCLTPRSPDAKTKGSLSDRVFLLEDLSPTLSKRKSFLDRFTPRGDRSSMNGSISDRGILVDDVPSNKKRQGLKLNYVSTSSVRGIARQVSPKKEGSISPSFLKMAQKAKKSLNLPKVNLDSLDDVSNAMDALGEYVRNSPKRFLKSPRGDK